MRGGSQKIDTILQPGWLDDFLSAQDSNEGQCHSKMLETQRTLDGVSRKLLTLSDEVTGQTVLIEGNTELIKDEIDNKHKYIDDHTDDVQTCDDKYDAAIVVNDRFRAELDELDQMAQPAVRSSIATDLDAAKSVQEQLVAGNLTSAEEVNSSVVTNGGFRSVADSQAARQSAAATPTSGSAALVPAQTA